MAGCYDRLISSVQGRTVENADLVNLPNWLPLRYRIRPVGADPGPWLSSDHGHLKEYRQTLDLRRGTLTRRSVYEDEAGRRLDVEQCRLVHMGTPHLAALHTDDVVWLRCRTAESDIGFALASRTVAVRRSWAAHG